MLLGKYDLEETPELLAVWPGCSVAGCQWRVWLGSEEASDRCYPHTTGEAPGYLPTEDEQRRRWERLVELMRRRDAKDIY